MGRHGTQRGGGSRRALALTLISVLLLAAVGGGYLWWSNRPTSAAAAQGPPAAAPSRCRCSSPASSPRSPVRCCRPNGADGCRVAQVRSTASAQSAVQAIGTGQVPDVWVPDSSTWLDALPGTGDLPTAPDGWEQGPSVATSPVVLVSPTAGKSAVDAAPTSWSEEVNVSGQVRMANPDTDTASRLAYYASRIDRPEALDLSVAGKLIFASRFAAASTQEQFAGLATTKDPLPFPASEQAAAAHAETAPGTLRTFVPRAGTISLDYPWLVNRALPPDQQALAATAVKALQSDAGHAAIAKAGFRTAATASGPAIDGARHAGLHRAAHPDRRRPHRRPRAVGHPAHRHADARHPRRLRLDEAAGQGHPGDDPGQGHRGGRGHRAADPPGGQPDRRLGVLHRPAGQGRRLQGARQGPAARHGVRRRAPGASTSSASRAPCPSGWAATPACTTPLPRRTRRWSTEYDDNYVNSVVIMTDGKNDDPGGGLDLNQLLARIKATSKGDRPVRVITIGMGEADPRALQAISRATGGTSYIANTPADIQRVFVQALLARTAK